MDQFGLDIEVQLELDQGEDGEGEVWDNKAEVDKTTPPHLQTLAKCQKLKHPNILSPSHFVSFLRL